MAILAGILIGYLLGAVPVGLIVARLAGFGDIRQHGSGNIGATNVWRLAGFKVAIWVFILDIGKGVAAVLLGRLLAAEYSIAPFAPEHFMVLCGIAAVLGNVFPVFLVFKGGKGVNTSLGVILTLLPLQAAIAFAVFVVVVLTTRFVSLGSILAGLTLSAIVIVQKSILDSPVADVYVALAILLAILIVFTHRQNIVRLVSGTESRLSTRQRNDQQGRGNHV
jgi:acyl phosphate:glycerol-3-phosphate acyltransferase